MLVVAALVAIPLRALSQEADPERAEASREASETFDGASRASDASEDASLPSVGDDALPTLGSVLVVAPRASESSAGAVTLGDRDLSAQRATATDTARLLGGVAGVSLYGAGGGSSLPAIHGLADERVNVEVDGAEPMAACPNHMNPALATIPPSKVGSVTVYRGITPVSAGGDSIGGAIEVEPAAPAFAESAAEMLATARGGAYFRSNANAVGYDMAGTLASENLHVSYQESNAQAENYTAAKPFKAGGVGSLLPGGEYLAGNVVGSSNYDNLHSRSVRVAGRYADHRLALTASLQQVGFEGFPNQRMDMTANESQQLGLRYAGQYGWGDLRADLYGHNTRHAMDMGPDRFFYGYGMPMEAKARTRGGSLEGDLRLSERDLLRVGSLYQTYDLDDWWPPVGKKGSMAPNTFWNIRDGVRDRLGIFGEWEAQWNPQWRTTAGVRGETVVSNAGKVEGYNDRLATWSKDAAAFNALDHRQRDFNLDWAALVRWAPLDRLALQAGYARQTRSPSLYERYPWSTNAMAALMNNFAGDGNGYVGNVDLRAEVAHTAAVTIDLHDDEGDDWRLEATGYVTDVDDFIDARRCDFGQCSKLNVTRQTGFVILQYANQSARLYGVDVSAHALLWDFEGLGSLTATAVFAYVRGVNRDTGDDLYHIMPPSGTAGLVHRLGAWTLAAEFQVAAAKTRISQVRNEVPTDPYSLLHLRASYAWKYARIDVSVENVLDRFYDLPLGGAYLGQGASMSTATIPWGVTVPGMGRSYNVALTLTF